MVNGWSLLETMQLGCNIVLNNTENFICSCAQQKESSCSKCFLSVVQCLKQLRCRYVVLPAPPVAYRQRVRSESAGTCYSYGGCQATYGAVVDGEITTTATGGIKASYEYIGVSLAVCVCLYFADISVCARFPRRDTSMAAPLCLLAALPACLRC